MHRRAVLGLLASTLFIPAAAAQPAPLEVTASFTILADLVRQIGGERVRVVSLVPENGDAHVFEPKPSDVATVARARVLVVNGLGFDRWTERLSTAAKFSGERIVAAQGVKPTLASGRRDSHAWQNPVDVKLYVAAIRDGLTKADPEGRGVYARRAESYLAELDALDAEIRALLAPIPAERRRIVTAHDAFGRFGEAYGIAFLAPQGVSTEAQASAKDVAALITQLRRQKAGAVFLENMTDPRMVERIAQETGAKVGGTLYGDALGGSVTTYLDMMRHNARAIAGALK